MTGKVLALQAGRPKFNPQFTYLRKLSVVTLPRNPIAVEAETDPEGFLTSPPRQLGEFQTNEKGCLKKPRQTAPEKKTSKFVLFPLYTSTDMCICTHVHTLIHTSQNTASTGNWQRYKQCF